MDRFLPNIVLLVLCTFIWTLWRENAYPFTELMFKYDGYAIHFVGGVAYAALQVTLAYMIRPLTPFTQRFFWIQASVAIIVLGIVEVLQVYDPSRHVQWGDGISQSLGVIVALLVLGFFHRKRVPI